MDSYKQMQNQYKDKPLERMCSHTRKLQKQVIHEKSTITKINADSTLTTSQS